MSENTCSSILKVASSIDEMLQAKTSPQFFQPRKRILQNFVLIWFDSDLEQSKENYQNILAELQRVVTDVNIFTQLDDCIAFLTEVAHMKVLLIVNSTSCQQLLSLVHDTQQLYMIFIYDNTRSEGELLIDKWPKVKSIHTEIKSLCEALYEAGKQCNRDSIAISFLTIDEHTANQSLDQLEPTFMYTQLFKEILLEIEHNDQSIKDFTLFCRKNNAKNPFMLNVINEFEREYCPESSIKWYTRGGFVCDMINHALRLMEADIIVNMGFFVRDLHQQIQELYQKQLSSYSGNPLVLYRGQGLSKTDFEKLQKTKAGLLSFNNFLSTTPDQDISMIFAESAAGKENTVGILFKMFINPSISSTPFASIRQISHFESEEEILFSMHSIFRIGEITKINDSDSLCQVELTLTSDDDQELRALTDRIRTEVAEETGWRRLGRLLIKVEQLDKAEELYKLLLQQTSDLYEEALYYNQLGTIETHKGNYDEAICRHEQALTILEQNFRPNHPSLATSYSNIGFTYHRMGKYSEAILFYQKGLEIRQEILSPYHPSLATSYNNIGLVYDIMGEYSKALSFHQKGLEIWQKALPPNHPSLAISYDNIASVYSEMGEYSKALSFYLKALKIVEKSLPPNHPSLATSYNNIGLSYRSMGEYSEALLFHQKGLEIWQKALPPNHPSLSSFYENIASIYLEMGEYLKALSFYQKGLDIWEKSSLTNHSDLATTYNNIGLTYDNLGDYSKAISFYRKGLEIWEETLPSNHPHLAVSYNNIGSVYLKTAEYSTALSFFQKGLEIKENNLSLNHLSLTTSYNNIGSVYDSLGDYSKALSFYCKGLEIKEKSLPPNHPDLVTSYNNIALAYLKLKEYSKALSFNQNALDILEKSLPPNYSSLATVYTNIGTVYLEMMVYPKALSFYEKGLETFEKILPLNHPSLATSYNNIGSVYHRMNDYPQALLFYRKGLEIWEKTLSPDHPDLAVSYNNIGLVYFQTKDYLTACSYLQLGFNMLEHILPSDHPKLLTLKTNLEFIKQKIAIQKRVKYSNLNRMLFVIILVLVLVLIFELLVIVLES